MPTEFDPDVIADITRKYREAWEKMSHEIKTRENSAFYAPTVSRPTNFTFLAMKSHFDDLLANALIDGPKNRDGRHTGATGPGDLLDFAVSFYYEDSAREMQTRLRLTDDELASLQELAYAVSSSRDRYFRNTDS